MKRFCVFVFATIFMGIVPGGAISRSENKIQAESNRRVHVYCKCQNSWINGRVSNFSQVELRDGTSFGPILQNAAVEVNGRRLTFDDVTQSYKGEIGEVEQWQEIPIRIQTHDNRKVRGHVVVVFMVQFTEPKPMAVISSSLALPVSWQYSEGSMHTVDLEIFSGENEPMGIEVRGNHTSVDLKKLGIDSRDGENLHLRVIPPWTSNYEFSGNLTRKSKAYFLTTATLTVLVAD